jgi:tripartite-type tricarboxylate transporter receptor subunit TctC
MMSRSVMFRQFRLVAVIMLLVLIGPVVPVAAASFPDHPVRIVVPFPAGGSNDVVARFLAMKLSEAWGQQIIIDNRAGAGGNIGAEMVAQSTPDG